MKDLSPLADFPQTPNIQGSYREHHKLTVRITLLKHSSIKCPNM